MTSGLGHPDARNAPFALLVHVACGSCRRIAERMWGIKPCGIPCRSDGVLPPPLTCTQFAKGQQRAKAGEKKAALAREFSISRETLYQYLNA